MNRDDWSLVSFRAPKNIIDEASEVVAKDARFKDLSHYLRVAIAVYNRQNTGELSEEIQ